jgi:hypothetical protein
VPARSRLLAGNHSLLRSSLAPPTAVGRHSDPQEHEADSLAERRFLARLVGQILAFIASSGGAARAVTFAVPLTRTIPGAAMALSRSVAVTIPAVVNKTLVEGLSSARR